jgi:hypothetical protein
VLGDGAGPRLKPEYYGLQCEDVKVSGPMTGAEDAAVGGHEEVVPICDGAAFRRN